MGRKKRFWVTKKNVLNELRSNNMTLQELRFFSIYLSKINPEEISTRIVRFPLSDFQKIMEFGRLNIAQLKASTDGLLCKIVHVPDENGRGFRSFQLFKECHIFQEDSGEWYVEIDAHDKALPLMFEFKNKFFKYELWNALRLKSANQVRMYEVLKQWENIGKREFKVDELRDLLGIAEDDYSGRTGWSDFKKKVLDSCQQALSETTDIKFTYERGKVGNGGKWLTIVFHIEKNEDYIDQLTLDEFIEQQPSAVIDVSDTDGEQLEGQMSFDELLGADEPSEVEEMDEQDEDERLLRIYGNDKKVELANACEYEFDNDELDVILGTIRNYDIPKDKATGDSFWGKVFWLGDRYTEFKIAAKALEKQGKPIKNRLKYFCKMLENRKENNNEI